MARLNRISGYADFVASWHDPAHPQNLTRVSTRSGKHGNVSVSRRTGDYRGYVLSRWHPQFIDSIERGVRDLVVLLVGQYRWLTYSSCEGHHYGKHGPPPVQRAVGICPRTAREREVILRTLHRASRTVNASHRASSVVVDVVESQLDTEGATYATIELIFCRQRHARWSTYFRDLDAVYHDMVSLLDPATTA